MLTKTHKNAGDRKVPEILALMKTDRWFGLIPMLNGNRININIFLIHNNHLIKKIQ